jgi:hypothetical protein
MHGPIALYHARIVGCLGNARMNVELRPEKRARNREQIAANHEPCAESFHLDNSNPQLTPSHSNRRFPETATYLTLEPIREVQPVKMCPYFDKVAESSWQDAIGLV